MLPSYNRPTSRPTFGILVFLVLLIASLSLNAIAAPSKYRPSQHRTHSPKKAPAAKPTPEKQTLEKNEKQAPVKKEGTTAQENTREEDPTKRLVGKVESVTRTVELQKKEGTWQKAKAKTEIRSQDKLKTGTRSVARIQLGDGSKVLLLQNSQAEFENLSTVHKTIKLIRGRVRAIVAKIQGGNNFKIKTPIGVASVRGTDFEVEFDENGQEMSVEVNEGSVGVAKLGDDLAREIVLHPGERVKFGIEGDILNPMRSGAVPLNRQDIHAEIQNTQLKEGIVSLAAEEARNADYRVGKSIMDVNGRRVRIEEYIMRPASNQFKLVVLNERSNRFDYMTYKGTFNTALPNDLSVALKQIGGKLGSTAPDYYLTDYEMLMSNTKDTVTDSASGGHLVKIEFSPDDSSKYRLTDTSDSTIYRDIDIAELQNDGSYKIYNPIKDSFSVVNAADKDEAIKIGVLDSVSGSYKNLASGDTYWKTRFNTYSYYVNTAMKTSYAKKSSIGNTLAVDLDATFSNAPIMTLSEKPSGDGALHNRLSLYYSDGSKTVYDNYIIDDNGKVAATSAFDGISTSEGYKNELEKWNYEQIITSDEMDGRNIDLTINPRIGTMSGLIQ